MRALLFSSLVIFCLFSVSCNATSFDGNQGKSNKHEKTVKKLCSKKVSANLMTTDHRGNIFLGHEESRSIKLLNLNGEDFIVTKGLNFPIAFDVDKKGRILVLEKEMGKVFKIDEKGLKSLVAENLENPGDIVVDRDGKVLVLTENGIEIFPVD